MGAAWAQMGATCPDKVRAQRSAGPAISPLTKGRTLPRLLPTVNACCEM